MTQSGVAATAAVGPGAEPARPLRDLLRRALPHRRTPQGPVYEGRGQPVIVFPREHSGPEATEPLRLALREAGFRSFDWGLGADTGPRGMAMHRWLRKLEECVIDVFEDTQAPVTLLGWGLSGLYARELSRRCTPLVRQVITLGTPFNTAADPERQCAVLRLLDAGPERMPLSMRNGLRRAPPVPCTSIYSRDDGVVRWEQCADQDTATCEHIEVAGVRHDQFATHPRVLEIVSQRLAQPEDAWVPFAAADARLFATA